jgi:hypothetical protein
MMRPRDLARLLPAQMRAVAELIIVCPGQVSTRRGFTSSHPPARRPAQSGHQLLLDSVK